MLPPRAKTLTTRLEYEVLNLSVPNETGTVGVVRVG